MVLFSQCLIETRTLHVYSVITWVKSFKPLLNIYVSVCFQNVENAKDQAIGPNSTCQLKGSVKIILLAVMPWHVYSLYVGYLK